MTADAQPAGDPHGTPRGGAAPEGEGPEAGSSPSPEGLPPEGSTPAPEAGGREHRHRSGERTLPLPAPPAPPVRASSMDSVTLPERSRHEPGDRPIRRRRSVTHLPVVVAPVDLPDDATGRVEIFAVRAPADREDPEPEVTPPPEGGERTREALAPPPAAGLLTLWSGWAAVGILAAVLAAAFVLLDLLLSR